MDVAAVEVRGVKTELRYILWVIASFLISGCGSKTLLVYRWDALEAETPPGPIVLSIYGSDEIAADPYGQDTVDGINLNGRPRVASTAGFVDDGEHAEYGVYFFDWQGDAGWGWGGGDYVERSFYYSSHGGGSR